MWPPEALKYLNYLYAETLFMRDDLDDLAAHGDMERKRKREDAMFPESGTPRVEAVVGPGRQLDPGKDFVKLAAVYCDLLQLARQLEREWNTVREVLANEMNRREAAERLLRAAQERELAAARTPSPEGTRTSDRASKIAAFRSLPANWDSYGAEQFTDKTIKLALEVSAQITPDWKVIPCADGPSVYFWRDDDREQIHVLALDEDQCSPQVQRP